MTRAEDRKSRQRLRRATLAVWFALAGTAVAQAQDPYLLQPGDSLQLDIAGLPEGSVTAPIRPDGSASLGHLGSLKVGGLALEDARALARSVAERQPFRRYSSDGNIVVIAVRPEDVRLGIDGYRPVRIGGVVVNPGRYAFKPGLTARALIADAGGVETFADLASDGLSLNDFINYRSDLDEAAVAAARSAIEIWSLRARLAENADLDTPEVPDSALRAAEFERLLSDARELVETDLGSLREERAFIEESLRQSRERLEILTKQRAELSELLAADEEEAERVQELVARAVAPTSRLIEIRRATAQSANRLLEVEETLSEARLEVTKLERRKNALEQDRRVDLLSDLERARGQQMEAELKRRRGAGLISGAPETDTQQAPAQTRFEVVAYRSKDGAVVPVAIGLDDVLQPGDLLEISHAAPADDTATPSE